MREIKFRGKTIFTKKENKFVYGYLIKMFGELSIMELNDENTVYSVDTETVSQYTGRNDKHGIEIYDKTIVLDDAGYNGLVEWSESESKYIVLFGSVEIELCEYKNADLEVIGNIHDNPELLEVKWN